MHLPSEVPDEDVNAFYRARTPEANSAVENELMKPARDAVNWLKSKGWGIDPARTDEYVQQVVMGMLDRTGSIPNWRSNTGFRRTTAEHARATLCLQVGHRRHEREPDIWGEATISPPL